MTNDFDENSQIGWLNLIQENSIKGKNNIFIVGTKLDLKAELDYQKGITSSTLTFSNGNLSSNGLKIKNFLMSHSIKEYFMVSSVLNYNVNECFESIFKEYLTWKSKEVSISDKDLQNCILF